MITDRLKEINKSREADRKQVQQERQSRWKAMEEKMKQEEEERLAQEKEREERRKRAQEERQTREASKRVRIYGPRFSYQNSNFLKFHRWHSYRCYPQKSNRNTYVGIL